MKNRKNDSGYLTIKRINPIGSTFGIFELYEERIYLNKKEKHNYRIENFIVNKLIKIEKL